MSDKKPKMNIDRWYDYTYQKKRDVYGAWVRLTPKQYRRIMHKMNKNNDYSLGLR